MDDAKRRELGCGAAPDRPADEVRLDLHQVVVRGRPAVDEEMADRGRTPVDRIDDVGDLVRDTVESRPGAGPARGAEREIAQQAHGAIVPPRGAKTVEARHEADALAIGVPRQRHEVVERCAEEARDPAQGRARGADVALGRIDGSTHRPGDGPAQARVETRARRDEPHDGRTGALRGLDLAGLLGAVAEQGGMRVCHHGQERNTIRQGCQPGDPREVTVRL